MSVFTNEIDVTNQPILVDGSATTQPVSGPLTDTQLRATAVPVSGPLTDTQLRATPVPVSSAPAVSGSATVTRVATSATVATLKAANANRLKLVVTTENGITYVKLGSAATTTDYSYYLPARSTLEIDGYTGIVTGIRSTGSDFVQVTEY